VDADKLKQMFLAEEAWEHEEADKDLLAKLIEAISILQAEIAKLNEALRE